MQTMYVGQFPSLIPYYCIARPTSLVNCQRYNYTLTFLSLLTDTPTLLYDYASDGAILIKSVEENEQDGGRTTTYYTK